MTEHHYIAKWVEDPPDPKGLWEVRVSDPVTNKILTCVLTHQGELAHREGCSLSVPGNSTQADIEDEVLEFLALYYSERAGIPPTVAGAVDINP